MLKKSICAILFRRGTPGPNLQSSLAGVCEDVLHKSRDIVSSLQTLHATICMKICMPIPRYRNMVINIPK